MKHLVWGLAMLLVVADGTAGKTGPSSFRCKNDLVQIGDSKASALRKCGVPVGSRHARFTARATFGPLAPADRVLALRATDWSFAASSCCVAAKPLPGRGAMVAKTTP